MATSREYWKNRWLQTHLDLERRNAPRIEDVEQLFADLELEVLEDLTKWYERYATNDGLTKEEASKMLSKVEQRNWSVTLKEFRERAIKGGYENFLNREYYNSRVTRLKMINTQMKMHMFEMAKQRESYMHSILTDEFHENYMRSTFEIHSQQGKILGNRVNVDFARYDQKEIDLVLKRPWKGSNFSKRVWKNDTKYLPEQLEKTLSKGLANGHGIDRMVKDFDKRFDVAKGRAVTLVQSETGHIQTQAELASMKQNGVDRYIYLATLETNTCSACALLDLKDFPVEDAVAGDNCPLLHPNCRCTIVPKIDEALISNTRWARDPNTGQSIRVPRMNYAEWKEGVEKRLKTGIIGLRTSDGVEINGISEHFFKQIESRGISIHETKDALENPLHIFPDKTDGSGLVSRKYVGKQATIAINPETGNLVTAYKTSMKRRNRYESQ